MRIINSLLKLFAFIAILGLFLIIPAFFQSADNPSEQTEVKNFALNNEAKLSAPSKETELEKTERYGEIDCENFDSNIFLSNIITKINNDRQLNGREDLSWSPELCQSAKLKADDMIEKNYFAHNSPLGVTPWYWIERVGYEYSVSGENLALNYYTAETAHTALMNSPGHRENILKDDFSDIGIAYASGKIDGKSAFIVVQHFAAPLPENPPVKYICEIEKAEKDLNRLLEQKEQINEYLDKAEKIKKETEDKKALKEINAYIEDLEDKKATIKAYIKETEEYLNKCESM